MFRSGNALQKPCATPEADSFRSYLRLAAPSARRFLLIGVAFESFQCRGNGLNLARIYRDQSRTPPRAGKQGICADHAQTGQMSRNSKPDDRPDSVEAPSAQQNMASMIVRFAVTLTVVIVILVLAWSR